MLAVDTVFVLPQAEPIPFYQSQAFLTVLGIVGTAIATLIVTNRQVRDQRDVTEMQILSGIRTTDRRHWMERFQSNVEVMLAHATSEGRYKNMAIAHGPNAWLHNKKLEEDWREYMAVSRKTTAAVQTLIMLADFRNGLHKEFLRTLGIIDNMLLYQQDLDPRDTPQPPIDLEELSGQVTTLKAAAKAILDQERALLREGR